MTWRKGHGNGKGVPRIEVLPPDELPVGIPDDARTERPGDRGDRGKFAPGNTIAARGGRGKRGATKLAVRTSLAKGASDADFAPYKRAAVSFRRAKVAELARSVGGGTCGAGPSSIVATAALQLAWSRYLSDRAAAEGDAEMALKASRLADASRQNLMAAHELCVREATARAASAEQSAPDPWERPVPPPSLPAKRVSSAPTGDDTSEDHGPVYGPPEGK